LKTTRKKKREVMASKCNNNKTSQSKTKMRNRIQKMKKKTRRIKRWKMNKISQTKISNTN